MPFVSTLHLHFPRRSRGIARRATTLVDLLNFYGFDGYRFFWLITLVSWYIGNLINNVHTINDLTKDRVFTIEPRGRCNGNKELTTISIRTRISHGKHPGFIMFQTGVELVFYS